MKSIPFTSILYSFYGVHQIKCQFYIFFFFIYYYFFLLFNYLFWLFGNELSSTENGSKDLWDDPFNIKQNRIT